MNALFQIKKVTNLGFFVIFVPFLDKKTIFDICSFKQLSCRNPTENLSFSSLHGKIAG